jgi:hypothetical protein
VKEQQENEREELYLLEGRKEGRRERRKKERKKSVIGGEGKELHVAFSLISNNGEVSRSSCTSSSAVVIFAR